MTGAKRQTDIRPLCFDHHSEMHFIVGSNPTNPPAFACTELDWLISYKDPGGYFYAGHVIPSEVEALPSITCSNDGALMYLAATRPEDQSFRLWRCPRCGQNRTNGDQTQSPK